MCMMNNWLKSIVLSKGKNMTSKSNQRYAAKTIECHAQEININYTVELLRTQDIKRETSISLSYNWRNGIDNFL